MHTRHLADICHVEHCGKMINQYVRHQLLVSVKILVKTYFVWSVVQVFVLVYSLVVF